jgi:LuxR family transcriptional regulator
VRGTAEAANVIGNAALAKAEMLGLCDAISADEAAAARSLSQAQSEILNWIAEGKSNTDIGTIMDMSERTVRYHVSVILQKLGVASRAQAAAIRNARRIDPGG